MNPVVTIPGLMCLDSLSRTGIRFSIIGDYARGMISDDFTPLDVCHIVSDDPSILIEFPLVIRQNKFKPRISERDHRAMNSRTTSISVEVISSYKDLFQESEQKNSYLTKEELEQFVSPIYANCSNKLLYVPFSPDELLYLDPDLAEVIYRFEFGHNKMYVHLVKRGEIKTYIDAVLRKSEGVVPASSLVALIDGEPYSCISVAIEHAREKLINILPHQGFVNERGKMDLLKSSGWKYVL